MTEEEAKTKWCPMARIVVNAQGYGAGNRFDDSVPNPEFMQSRCIASDCMMWREKFIPSSVDPKYDTTEYCCGLVK